MLSHAVLIPMPHQKHRKHRRRCENWMLAPYSFLVKHSMPARTWAQLKPRSLMERKQRRRFWPADSRARPKRSGDIPGKATMSALPPKADIRRDN